VKRKLFAEHPNSVDKESRNRCGKKWKVEGAGKMHKTHDASSEFVFRAVDRELVEMKMRC
jgi:hypothetical protein